MKHEQTHTQRGRQAIPARTNAPHGIFGRAAAFALPILLILAIFVVYFHSLSGPFYFDDAQAVVKNETIRSLWPITRVLAPQRFTPVAGRPLSNLSFAMNYAFGQLDPRGYRVTNVALHAICALLLWWIIRQALRQPIWHGRFDGATEPLAAAVSLLWAVHPLLVDAVGYVTQRSELLVSMFYLLTLACAIRGWDSPRDSSRYVWFTLAILACAAGMSSKEVMVSAPLAVLLYDRAFVSGGFAAALNRSKALYIGLAMTWILLGFLIAGQGRSDSAGFHLGVSPWQYLLTQSRVICEYLRMTVWPMRLSITHRVPIAGSLVQVLPQALFIIALLLTTIIALWRWPRAAFPLACFFLILAPTSSFYPIIYEVAAERRMYLPLAAMVALGVPLAWLLVSRYRRIPGASMIMGVAVVAIILGMLTRAHTAVRR